MRHDTFGKTKADEHFADVLTKIGGCRARNLARRITQYRTLMVHIQKSAIPTGQKKYIHNLVMKDYKYPQNEATDAATSLYNNLVMTKHKQCLNV